MDVKHVLSLNVREYRCQCSILHWYSSIIKSKDFILRSINWYGSVNVLIYHYKLYGSLHSTISYHSTYILIAPRIFYQSLSWINNSKNIKGYVEFCWTVNWKMKSQKRVSCAQHPKNLGHFWLCYIRMLEHLQLRGYLGVQKHYRATWTIFTIQVCYPL